MENTRHPKHMRQEEHKGTSGKRHGEKKNTNAQGTQDKRERRARDM